MLWSWWWEGIAQGRKKGAACPVWQKVMSKIHRHMKNTAFMGKIFQPLMTQFSFPFYSLMGRR